jgi:hypothetical protein
MATAESVTDDDGWDCNERSRVLVTFSSIAQFAEGESRVFFSLRKPGIRLLPSSSAAVLGSGPEMPGEALSALVAITGWWDPGKDRGQVKVTGDSVDSDGPVDDILPRVGLEASDGRFSESGGVQGPSLRWSETAAGGEVEK